MDTLNILWEDNHLLCVEKPINVPVQADSSQDEDLLNRCKAYIAEKYQKPGAVYLGLVHRLDRPVGGAMVFARTSKAAQRLAQSMKKGTWHKTYLAVVSGSAPRQGTLEDWLLKDETTRISRAVPEGTEGAKYAKLRFTRLCEAEGFSLLSVELFTGRHHQIRVQLSHAGFPIWGDQRYHPGAKPGQQIALWALWLAFPHPTAGKEVSLFCPPPDARPWREFRDKLLEWTVPVVYEDGRIVVFDKPDGLEVQGRGSLEELAQRRWPGLRACHRLDVNTGGLVAFARDPEAEEALCAAIRDRLLEKRYRCIVKGRPQPGSARLSHFLVKDGDAARVRVLDRPAAGAKEIVTVYRTIWTRRDRSLLEVELVTGRTHQIRAHLAYLGHPILGDDKYGDREWNKKNGRFTQALYACRLTFHFEKGSPLSDLEGKSLSVEPVW